MKRFLQFILIASFLSACGSSKTYLERTNENKALQDAVRKLNKNSTDELASQAVPILYSNILKSHQARIASYRTGSDIGRWDKIINDYSNLQDAYENIVNSTAAFRLVTPENFSTQLLEARQAAAEEYYVLGESFLTREGRENAKRAYSYFSKAGGYVSRYKDIDSKKNQAYENAIVDVVINPIQDDRYFYNSGWGNAGYDYSNEYFQRTLVRDLSYDNNNSNSNNYAARFYSDWEARRENVTPDWVVDLRLRNMNLPQPSNNSYRQQRSAQVQNGKDTAGRPIYQTVYATINVNRMSFTAHADMDVYIRDIVSNSNISTRNFREDYRWQEERATYTGDSRALSNADWQMINNNNYYAPRREDVLNELYRKIYPQVLNAIKYSVNW